MKKIDHKIIEWFQTFYLWLLDRTGVYAATIIFVLWAVHTAMRNPVTTIDLIMLGGWGLSCAWRYWLQEKNHAAYNALVEFDRGFWLRYVCIGIFIGTIAWELVAMNLRPAIGDLCMIVMFYFITAKVRKREPPERKFWAPATSLNH